MNAFASFAEPPRWPGRTLVYGAWEHATEHTDASDAEALALALGAALALAPGIGAEPSLITTSVAQPDESWWEVAALAGHLSPPGLLLACDDAISTERLQACGWRINPEPHHRDQPCALTGQTWRRHIRAMERRVWTPVDLPSLGRACLPSWPVAAHPQAQGGAALTWLAAREPSLVTLDGSQPWLLALAAERACHGQRCVWRVPRGTRLLPALLERIGRLQMPVKLLLEPGDQVALPTGWWTANAHSAGHASAMLAWILGDESPWCLILPTDNDPNTPPWPPGTAWEPTGR